jgi:hypothetical protein
MVIPLITFLEEVPGKIHPLRVNFQPALGVLMINEKAKTTGES